MTEAIHLTEKELRDLNAVVRERLAPQSLVERARILLQADAGVSIRATAQRLGLGRATVQRWRRRWVQSPVDWTMRERLSDAPRSGTPPTFAPEQICSILALACEPAR